MTAKEEGIIGVDPSEIQKVVERTLDFFPNLDFSDVQGILNFISSVSDANLTTILFNRMPGVALHMMNMSSRDKRICIAIFLAQAAKLESLELDIVIKAAIAEEHSRDEFMRTIEKPDFAALLGSELGV